MARFTAAQLASWQAALASTLTMTTATVERNPNRGAPVHGVVADSWPAVSANYTNLPAGYRAPTAGFEQNLASELGLLQAWVVSLPANDANGVALDVRVGDRLVIAGLPPTLTVQAPINQSLNLLTQVMAGTARTK